MKIVSWWLPVLYILSSFWIEGAHSRTVSPASLASPATSRSKASGSPHTFSLDQVQTGGRTHRAATSKPLLWTPPGDLPYRVGLSRRRSSNVSSKCALIVLHLFYAILGPKFQLVLQIVTETEIEGFSMQKAGEWCSTFLPLSCYSPPLPVTVTYSNAARK